MAAVQGGPCLDFIVRKWRDLAERRLAYFTELYRSGRWTHYYTRENFAVRVRNVIKAVKVWGELAGGRRAERPMARDDDLRPAA